MPLCLAPMAEYGYRMEPNSWGDLGDVMLIVMDEDGLEAAVDVRGRGQARVLPLP